MSDESAGSATSKATAKPNMENQTFQEVLKALLGKVVTVVNPESYEQAPMGFQVRTGFYRGKVAGLGKDFLIIMTEFNAKGDAEPVKQYIPLSRIKRISLMKSDRILHL